MDPNNKDNLKNFDKIMDKARQSSKKGLEKMRETVDKGKEFLNRDFESPINKKLDDFIDSQTKATKAQTTELKKIQELLKKVIENTAKK